MASRTWVIDVCVTCGAHAVWPFSCGHRPERFAPGDRPWCHANGGARELESTRGGRVNGPEVLIRGDWWMDSSEEYRQQVRSWLRANGVEPNDVAVEDVELHVVDAPAIAYTALERDSDGFVVLDRATQEPRMRRVHSLMRVPFPDDLRRPW